MILNNQLFNIFMCIILLSVFNSANAVTTSNRVTVTARFTAPPCTLTMPDRVNLGAILPGAQSYPPFIIRLDCPLPAAIIALYAEIVQGSLSAGSNNRVDMTGPAGSSGTPVKLWLTDNDGKEVMLDGSGSSEESGRFCSGTGSRNCTITPNTEVEIDTPRGLTSAMLRFNVIVP